jgi:signal transduction histidine kinase
VSNPSIHHPALPGGAPYVALAVRLRSLVESLDAGGQANAADLRELVAQWEKEQREWDERLLRMLSLHHDINNALVGVRGNAQLLLMGPLGQQPGVKDRLEIVIRESTRIREAASMLRELKHGFSGIGPSSRAA